MNSGRTVGVIPARYGSSRLPGKPLLDIGGKPMIIRVMERALEADCLERVIVATDHEDIVRIVEEYGGEAFRTPEKLDSGTDRVACVAEEMDAGIFVNIQGDEPFIEPAAIQQVADLLAADAQADMSTLVHRIRDERELFSRQTVKVVLAADGRALYFSRSAIPFCRDAGTGAEWLKQGCYYRHLGLYAYRKDFLLRFSSWPAGLLEKLEKLEQLRALENGARIIASITEAVPFGVDTEEDLRKARKIAAEIGK